MKKLHYCRDQPMLDLFLLDILSLTEWMQIKARNNDINLQIDIQSSVVIQNVAKISIPLWVSFIA
jgi:hypothetical protein